MRSPWQLIKGLISRGNPDEASASVDQDLPMPDRRREVLGKRSVPQGEVEEHPGTNSQSNTDGTEPDRQSTPVGADAEIPSPAAQNDPVPLEVANNAVSEADDKSVSAALVVRAVERDVDSGPVSTAPGQQRGKAAQVRGKVGKLTPVNIAAEHPLGAKRTALDEAAKSDAEIKNLRLQLSAKLLEQNMLLRRMIERYDDR